MFEKLNIDFIYRNDKNLRLYNHHPTTPKIVTSYRMWYSTNKTLSHVSLAMPLWYYTEIGYYIRHSTKVNCCFDLTPIIE